MADRQFPELVIDLERLRKNTEEIKRRCGERGIEITAVIKGVSAIPQIVRTILSTGIDMLSTSRLSHIEKCLAEGITARWLLLRIPQMCECADVVRLTDVSLESSIEVIYALEKECEKQCKTHKIIMMVDTGDLREGYWDRQQLLEDCAKIQADCPHVIISGIGSNFTDYGATVPTVGKMEELIAIRDRMEKLLGYELEYVSGGSTTSYPLVHRGEMPRGINHLRIGEAIILDHDLPIEWGLEGLEYMDTPMLLRAQVIEVFDKPTAPIGETATDAFDNRPVFDDRGIRRRAIIALGRLDVGDARKLVTLDKGVEILAATSDHTMLDIQDCPRKIRVGDIMEFRLNYENIMYAAACADVRKEFING